MIGARLERGRDKRRERERESEREREIKVWQKHSMQVTKYQMLLRRDDVNRNYFTQNVSANRLRKRAIRN